MWRSHPSSQTNQTTGLHDITLCIQPVPGGQLAEPAVLHLAAQAGLGQPSTQSSQMYGAGLNTLMGGGDFSQASLTLGGAEDLSHLINLDSLLSQVGGLAGAHIAAAVVAGALPGAAVEVDQELAVPDIVMLLQPFTWWCTLYG